MEFTHTTYENLSPSLRKQIIGLTNRHGKGSSGMLSHLRYNKNVPVILAMEGQRVLGWAMIPWIASKKDSAGIYIFVRRSCRRQGVGTAIIKEGIRVYSKCRVYPWDGRSREFFTKLKDKDTNIYF